MNSGFLIHLSNTFLVSHQRPYPIYNSKRPTCHNSIQDHRSGNREDLTANTKNLPLLLIFNRRCSNRVGKAGNRNKCTGTAPFGKQWIKSGKVLTISYGANYMTPIHDEANDDLHVHFREAFLKHLKLI